MQVSYSKIKQYSAGLIVCGAMLLSAGVFAETITDVAGRQIEIPNKVERILLGEGRLIHAIALLEGKQPFKRIVGWQGDFRKLDPTNYAIYHAKFPEIDKIPLIGNTSAESVSAEKALTLLPDIAIFGLSGHGPGKDSELVNQMTKAGVPVVFVDFRTEPLKNTIPSIRILGKALQKEDVAERYIKFYQDNLDKVTKVTDQLAEDKKVSVFIDMKAGYTEDCCTTAGNGNMGNFVDIAGGKNIAKSLLPASLGTINLEKVIDIDPEVYIATGGKAGDGKSPGMALGTEVSQEQAIASIQPRLQRTGISSLKAVKNGHTHAIWHNFYNSPYNIIAIQLFAKWFYPEEFKDLDPKATMDTLYRDFLVVEPTGTLWLDSLTK